MSWNNYYKERTISASEACTKIKSKDRVVVAHAVAEPIALIDALVKNHQLYQNLEIVHMISLRNSEYCNVEMQKHFRHNSLFLGSKIRKAVNEGRADFTPCYFSQIPSLFKDGYLPIDVALVQVSPPDSYGYCSLGVSVDYGKAAVETAKLVIAQVNSQMPRTLGEAIIHISQISYFVECSMPLIELLPAKTSEVEKAIGGYCASLVEDGSTLQLGIGSIPDAVLTFLKDKKDLGIHSEMVSDGIIPLVEGGVITNKLKTLHKDKIILSFLMGTKKLYDFVDNNPMIYMAPVDYVNNPYVIAQNEKMISINSCVQVDLFGQVCSESVGIFQISGVGGQVDFVRGANMSIGGKSIIAMSSTTSGNKVSKIVSFLDEGATVTTTRYDVNYIVTEYGIACLKGKTLRERARSLIAIAHPDFRNSLKNEWENRFKQSF